jgi:hypothetical protein
MPAFSNDGRYADESKVLVRWPVDPNVPQSQWPWVKGLVTAQVDNDEWEIALYDERCVETEDDGATSWPSCYRSACELEKPAYAHREAPCRCVGLPTARSEVDRPVPGIDL